MDNTDDSSVNALPEKVNNDGSDKTEWLMQWRRFAKDIPQGLSVIETHAHYDQKQYSGIVSEVLELIHSAGVSRCIIPSIHAFKRDAKGNIIDVNRGLISSFEQYEWISYVIGSHPRYICSEADIWNDGRWQDFEELLGRPRIVGVKTGLDYSSSPDAEEKAVQKAFLGRFAECAERHGLPLVLHIREGIEGSAEVDRDAISTIGNRVIKNGAVVHCFGGSSDRMQAFLDAGISYFGIGGRLLAEEELQDTVKNMPLESILLETDSPYVNRHPEITGRNTSLLLFAAAGKLAEIKGIETKEIIKIANDNALRLFSGLKQ